MDQTDTPPPSDARAEVSEHARDYLDSLQARFDELTSRIEEAAKAATPPEPEVLEEIEAVTDLVEAELADTAPAPPADTTDPPPKAPEPTPHHEPIQDRRVAAPDAEPAPQAPLPRPVASNRTGSRVWIFATLGVLAAVAGAFLAGSWWTNRTTAADPTPPVTTLAPASANPPTDEELSTAIAAAIATVAGTDDVTATVSDGIVRLQGTSGDAATIDAVADAVLGLDGIRRLDTRITVVEPTPPDPESIVADAEAALQDSGLAGVTVTVADGTATIGGVAPFDQLADGYFAYTDELRSALLDIDGIDAVTTRLHLRGDEAALREELSALVTEQPIIFASGSAEIDEAAQATLDRAAEAIIAHPGLRILIAGHTDSAGSTAQNEQLAATRGGAVLQYLLSQGVPVTRLQVVAYGELFPGEGDGSQTLNRRIEFEVAP